MAEKYHGEDYREELSGRADRRADERVEAGDSEVNEILARGGRHGQAQHVALLCGPEKKKIHHHLFGKSEWDDGQNSGYKVQRRLP